MFYIEKNFKDAIIGKVPRQWTVAAISEIAEKKKGAIKIGPFGSQLKKCDLSSDGIKVYGQENVMSNDFTLGNRYVSIEKFQSLKGFELFPNDVLVTMMGSVGHSTIFSADAEKGIMDSHLIRIQSDKAKCLPSFLSMLLSNYNRIQTQIKSMSQGAIMSGLNSQIIRNLKIPIPSIEEQKGLAKLFTEVDLAFQKTDEVIAKTERLKKGLMQKLLTRGIGHKEFKETEIGRFPKNWKIQTLTDALGGEKEAIVAGPFGSNLKVVDYRDAGIPIIRLQNIERGRFINKDMKYISAEKAEELSYHNFVKGDLVLAKLGDPIGKTCIVPDALEKGIVVADVVRIRVPWHLMHKEYLMYVLNSSPVFNQLSRRIIGSTRPRVNISQVRDLIIPIPPKSEQEQIAKVLQTIDKKLQIEKSEKTKLERIKRGLMDLLLAGKIRIKVD